MLQQQKLQISTMALTRRTMKAACIFWRLRRPACETSAFSKRLLGSFSKIYYSKLINPLERIEWSTRWMLSMPRICYPKFSTKNVDLLEENMEVESTKSEPPLKKAVDNKSTIREQSAELVAGGNVFYNPVQEFNRDLSVAVLNVYFRILQQEKLQKKKKSAHVESGNEAVYKPGTKYENGLQILEALSATGLRSIRYAKEIAGVNTVIANDLSKQAVESIKENVRHNEVEHLVEVSHANAMTYMYLASSTEKRFDAIDLDPYGCPNRFLDGAVQSIADGGILLVTATDMAVLAGNAPEACFVKYGCVPLRMKSCHEMALRILLHTIETHANRYGKYIEPLLSISADFYVRIFVRIHTSQAKCKFSMSKQSMIYQCTGCDTYTLHPLGSLKPNPTEQNPNQVKFGIPTGPPVGTHCAHCGHKHHIGGPIWSDAIHNTQFVSELLDEIQKEPLSELGTQKRLIGVLSVVLEELPDVPLYYTLDKLCSVVKLEIIPMLKFRSALLHAGYRVSYSHAFRNSIKTDAPPNVLWDIMRCWHKIHPVKPERMLDGTPLKAILEKTNEQEYNFDQPHPAANPKSRKSALTRFQANPTPHWGPGTRATIMVGQDKLPKRHRNQNKKSRRPQPTNADALPDATTALVSDEEDELSKAKHPKISE